MGRPHGKQISARYPNNVLITCRLLKEKKLSLVTTLSTSAILIEVVRILRVLATTVLLECKSPCFLCHLLLIVGFYSYSASDGSLLRELEYEDAVQCVKFDTEGKHLIAAGSDGSVRMWA
mmetsp:Transcript_49678/g.127740  ORF Transcript_49678/g.127740 Transcript_49678/m.127740 type:complete len:120 (+) Transcript_49678:1680-2039(+)